MNQEYQEYFLKTLGHLKNELLFQKKWEDGVLFNILYTLGIPEESSDSHYNIEDLLNQGVIYLLLPNSIYNESIDLLHSLSHRIKCKRNPIDNQARVLSSKDWLRYRPFYMSKIGCTTIRTEDEMK